jgi:hypothetical protein
VNSENFRVRKRSQSQNSTYLQQGAGGLTPVILATQEAEIRRIVVQSQPMQIVCKTLAQEKKTKPKKNP